MDVLCAELNEIKIVHNILKGISFKEYATVRIMDEGLKMTIEDMKCVQTSAYIPKDVFSSYIINLGEDEVISFQINLKIFTECLDIFGDEGQPSMKILYRGIGMPFSLLLTHEDGQATANCDIKTLEMNENFDMNCDEENILNSVLAYAPTFVELLMTLDMSSDIVEIITSPDPPYIRFNTFGIAGESIVDISRTSELIISFKCGNVCSFRYSFIYLRQLFKVMASARTISMAVNENGLLVLKLIIPTENEKAMFVEYCISSIVGDD